MEDSNSNTRVDRRNDRHRRADRVDLDDRAAAIPVPSGLWRLPLPDAFGRFVPGPHLWWSGAAPRFDLLDREDRARAYELVLREGQPEDIRSIVDGALLIDAWPNLVVPAELRRAWQLIIDRYRVELAEAS